MKKQMCEDYAGLYHNGGSQTNVVISGNLAGSTNAAPHNRALSRTQRNLLGFHGYVDIDLWVWFAAP